MALEDFAQIRVPDSNMGGDRIYCSIFNKLELVNKDGTIYKGKIDKKSIKVDGVYGNFMSYVYVTADERWFDRGGMPISKPKNLLTRKEEDEEKENLHTRESTRDKSE